MSIRLPLLRSVLATACALLAGAAVPAAAQTFSGTVSVVNLLPNTIVGHEDLDFGYVIAPVAAATLTIDPQTGALSTTGGLVLAGGTPNPGEFTGYGSANRLVVLNGPATITLTRSGGGSMTVNTLRMSVNGGGARPISGAHRLDAAGFIFLKIGGRLNVGAGQLQGDYSGTYVITANYL